MEAVRTSETSVDNHFTRQYIPEDNSEHHTRRRENLKSHIKKMYEIIDIDTSFMFIFYFA
jgi:CCR4-NOT transcriptional regulation complex NOT5 subunit